MPSSPTSSAPSVTHSSIPTSNPVEKNFRFSFSESIPSSPTSSTPSVTHSSTPTLTAVPTSLPSVIPSSSLSAVSTSLPSVIPSLLPNSSPSAVLT